MEIPEFQLPAFTSRFERNVRVRLKQDARQWMEELEGILFACAEEWDLETIEPFESSSHIFMADTQLQSGQKAVLKVGCPTPEWQANLNALTAFSHKQIAGVLGMDMEHGAVLLLKMSPGMPLTDLAEYQDEHATHIASDIIRDLPVDVPADVDFPTVRDWSDTITRAKQTGVPFSMELLDTAKHFLEELEATKNEDKLLHGDLHHDNILQDEDDWRVINPVGVIADPTYEAARFIHSPRDLLDTNYPETIMRTRVDIFATLLQEDRGRLIKWAYFDCVLTACLSVEEQNRKWQDRIECAQMLREMLQTADGHPT